jgi:hypothetical protein
MLIAYLIIDYTESIFTTILASWMESTQPTPRVVCAEISRMITLTCPLVRNVRSRRMNAL